MATRAKSNFAAHQAQVVDKNLGLIEAELKDLRGRAGVAFGDIDSLVRYLAKVTGLHRTTLKRNTEYRKAMRNFLGRQPGSTALVKVDDAPPELLRAMVEERDLTIGNLGQQLRILKARLDTLEMAAKALSAPIAPVAAIPAPDASAAKAEAKFQDTAFALWQLIQHLNTTAGAEIIVIDEASGTILDAAIPNPRKRREHAIGPERTKAFIAWWKANKDKLQVG